MVCHYREILRLPRIVMRATSGVVLVRLASEVVRGLCRRALPPMLTCT